jgi:hypothetical protein
VSCFDVIINRLSMEKSDNGGSKPVKIFEKFGRLFKESRHPLVAAALLVRLHRAVSWCAVFRALPTTVASVERIAGRRRWTVDDARDMISI